MAMTTTDLVTPDGVRVRMVNHNDAPWLQASDLCKAAGLSNAATALRRVADCDKQKLAVLTSGGVQEPNFVSASGALTLVQGARMPRAELIDWLRGVIGDDVVPTSAYAGVPSCTPQVFDHEKFGAVCVVDQAGDHWFLASDICSSLELANVSRALDSIDEGDKRKLTISNVANTPSLMWFVNEPGLYTLVFKSQKPEAKAFKHWITHDVLPTIRRTGGYVANDDLFVATYLPHADEPTVTLFKGLLQSMRGLNDTIAQQKTALTALATTNAALYADNSTWEPRTIITTLMPAICAKTDLTMQHAYNRLYYEAKKRYHFDLTARRRHAVDGDTRPTIDFAKEDELHKLAVIAATQAYRYKVDFARLLNPVNAAYVQRILEEAPQ